MNLRRCPACKHHLERWGSRLYCFNAQCTAAPTSEPPEPESDQLTLLDSDAEAA